MDDAAPKTVFITQHEIGDYNSVVNVCKDLATAKFSFGAYLDAIEAGWRETDGKIDPSNTFNRFCEPTGEYAFSGQLNRLGENHLVCVKEFTVD